MDVTRGASDTNACWEAPAGIAAVRGRSIFSKCSLRFSKARRMRSGGLALAMILLVNVPAVAAERAPERVTEHAPQHVTEHPPQHPAEHPAPERVCLTAAQAREIVAARRLAEPFRVMQTTARHFQAEALRAKLCRRKDELVYEITLLRRDGRVIHVSLNAVSGKIVRTVNAK